jgi:SAM-dependent methyltransferase
LTSPTIYDRVAYPTAVFAQTHPGHLAAIARLHGLDAAPPATARVLEIGCGDGMNLLAMAAAYPQASFAGFDLAASVIARGRARAEAAGLANVRLETLDIVEAERTIDGPFDYVIAHGIYAWVPEPVRAALLALAARLLSPRGIAFISYNAYPGGHFRSAVRDLMLHYARPEMDAATRLRTARRALEDFVEASTGDEPVRAAMRHQAKATLNQIDGLLFHDELSEVYAPQLLTAVAGAAKAAGLSWLGDAGRAQLLDGFIPEGHAPGEDADAQALGLAQERDFLEVRFFRRSLFLRSEARPSRRLDPERALGLWARAHCERTADGAYRGEGGEEFQIRDPGLDAAFGRLVDARPGRLPVDGLVEGVERLSALVDLFNRGSLSLHVSQAPFACTIPPVPVASPLARAMAEEGLDTLCTLDHSAVRIEDPALLRFLARLDGRGEAALREAAAQSGFADPDQWRQAVELACSKALLVPDRS